MSTVTSTAHREIVPTDTPPTEIQAAPLARSVWRRARLWLILAVLVVLGAIVVSAVSTAPSRALDPGSSAHDGSKALSVLLGARGTHVHASTALADAVAAPAATTVLVAFPDDLGAKQLAQLVASGHRLVVLDPSSQSLAAVAPERQRNDDAATDPVAPGCSWAGAQAAGPVQFPEPLSSYSGDSACYGGAVVVTDQLVVLGTADLLRNDQLARSDIAALDINAISADGSVRDVDWLLPGPDDTGAGSPTIWALFPPWAQRSFWWLLVCGVLAALWKGRRLGPGVEEPLPVLVRSAEIVEGHGRLYQRAAARERAAQLLWAAAIRRLASRLGVDRRATPAEVIAVAGATGPDGPRIAAALRRPAPTDDDELLAFARGLGDVETSLSNPTSSER